MNKHNLKKFNGGFNGIPLDEYTAWVDSLISNKFIIIRNYG